MFLLSTARELRMTVSQLLENTNSADLTEWAAFLSTAKAATEVNDTVDVDAKLRAVFGDNNT